MLIEEATFVVVDAETTGLSRDKAQLIEIGAVKIRGDYVLDEFESLINPQRPVPWRISKLTGIHTSMVAQAPPARPVLRRFLKFVDNATLVIHNAHFDLSIINAELIRAGLAPLANASVCTLRIARRLLRRLSSRSLSSLKVHFNVEVETSHRAMADAGATREVFLHMVRLLRGQEGIATVEDLLAYQRRTYRTTGPTPRHVQILRASVLPVVPKVSGVYFMYDAKGRLLYIGKAKNLARRVQSYFAGIESKDARTRQLVRKISAINWIETKTELGAILLELQLRKKHQPPFNRADRRAQQRRFAAAPFLRIGVGGGDRRITVVRHIQDDGASYYGPFRADKLARTITMAFFAVYGEHSTEGDDDVFASLRSTHLGGMLSPEGLVEARSFMRAPSDNVMLGLVQKMKVAAEQQDYECAARYRDWMEALRSFCRQRYVTGESVFDRNGVIVVPRKAFTELHYVRFGRPVGETTVSCPASEDELGSVKAHIVSHFVADTARPPRYTFEQLDEIRQLSLWLHREGPNARVIVWNGSVDVGDFHLNVRDAL